MKLAARIAKVEAAAGKGRQNCPACRLNIRIHPPDPDAPKLAPEDLVDVPCEMCGDVIKLTLRTVPEELRDAHRLQHSFTLEDFYTDRRANALAYWFNLQPDRMSRRRRKAVREQRRQNGRPAKPLRLTPAQRCVVALRAEVKSWADRYHREMREKHGKPFPEIVARVQEIYEERKAELRESIKGLPYGCIQEVNRLETEISDRLACVELEKIIWGDARAGTLAAIEGLRVKIAAAVEEAREEEHKREKERQKREEERRREAAEREERYRLEREQRERERLERESAQKCPAVSKDFDEHPFWAAPESGKKNPQPVNIPSEDEARIGITVGVAPSAPDPLVFSVPKSQPPDDGTALYQLKLAHYKRTGSWPAFSWERTVRHKAIK